MQVDKGKSLCPNVFKRALFLIGIAMFAWPDAAQATDVLCVNNSDLDGPALQAALASDTTVNVTGTCLLFRPLTIQSLTNLLIQVDPDNPPTATFSMPVIGCSDITSPARPLLNITDSRNVTLRGLLITGGRGISLNDSNVTLQGVTVEGSRGDGISVGGASGVNLQGAYQYTVSGVNYLAISPNTVQNNCNSGISSNNGSNVSVNLQNTISGNGGSGVNVGNGSRANLNACCTPDVSPDVINQDDPMGALILIQNNRRGVQAGAGGFSSINGGASQDGTVIGMIEIKDNREHGVFTNGGNVNLSNQVIVQNNMIWTDPNSVSPAAIDKPAGVLATYGGTAFVGDGTEIRDNVLHGAAGILADFQGIVRLGSPPPTDPTATPPFTGITVTGNAAEGVKLLHMSIAESLPDNLINSNGGAANATCDSSSWLIGNVTGIATVKCANTEQTKKNN